MDSKSKRAFLKYAAIDIGSNAVRLLLCNAVEEQGVFNFKKEEFIRIPLRLGEDVFKDGKISSAKTEKLVKTIRAFSLLIDVYEPTSHMVCATASMREAKNNSEIVKRVRQESGLNIEIIDGKTEAELIYSNHIEEQLNRDQSYLYIDVGGGSTEITVFHRGICFASQSFNIGTLRFLYGKVPREKWEEMKFWVTQIAKGHTMTAIGSGGNINRINKIIGSKEKIIDFVNLKKLYSEMKALNVDDRMERWNLNSDRADVIVPAAKIFLTIMKAGDINNVLVPQVGLADGIIRHLHRNGLVD